MKTYQIPAGLESYRTSKGDYTLRLTFGTQELTPEVMANIHWSLNKVGWLAFSPDPFATHELEEIEKMKVEFDDTGKPPSQRLRAVLYRCWEQKPEGYKIFNDFYMAQMEKLITHFKNKLDP
jgi:hypothetical protein